MSQRRRKPATVATVDSGRIHAGTAHAKHASNPPTHQPVVSPISSPGAGHESEVTTLLTKTETELEHTTMVAIQYKAELHGQHESLLQAISKLSAAESQASSSPTQTPLPSPQEKAAEEEGESKSAPGSGYTRSPGQESVPSPQRSAPLSSPPSVAEGDEEDEPLHKQLADARVALEIEQALRQEDREEADAVIDDLRAQLDEALALAGEQRQRASELAAQKKKQELDELKDSSARAKSATKEAAQLDSQLADARDAAREARSQAAEANRRRQAAERELARKRAQAEEDGKALAEAKEATKAAEEEVAFERRLRRAADAGRDAAQRTAERERAKAEEAVAEAREAEKRAQQEAAKVHAALAMRDVEQAGRERAEAEVEELRRLLAEADSRNADEMRDVKAQLEAAEASRDALRRALREQRRDADASRASLLQEEQQLANAEELRVVKLRLTAVHTELKVYKERVEYCKVHHLRSATDEEVSRLQEERDAAVRLAARAQRQLEDSMNGTSPTKRHISPTRSSRDPLLSRLGLGRGGDPSSGTSSFASPDSREAPRGFPRDQSSIRSPADSLAATPGGPSRRYADGAEDGDVHHTGLPAEDAGHKAGVEHKPDHGSGEGGDDMAMTGGPAKHEYQDGEGGDGMHHAGAPEEDKGHSAGVEPEAEEAGEGDDAEVTGGEGHPHLSLGKLFKEGDDFGDGSGDALQHARATKAAHHWVKEKGKGVEEKKGEDGEAPVVTQEVGSLDTSPHKHSAGFQDSPPASPSQLAWEQDLVAKYTTADSLSSDDSAERELMRPSEVVGEHDGRWDTAQKLSVLYDCPTLTAAVALERCGDSVPESRMWLDARPHEKPVDGVEPDLALSVLSGYISAHEYIYAFFADLSGTHEQVTARVKYKYHGKVANTPRALYSHVTMKPKEVDDILFGEDQVGIYSEVLHGSVDMDTSTLVVHRSHEEEGLDRLPSLLLARRTASRRLNFMFDDHTWCRAHVTCHESHFAEDEPPPERTHEEMQAGQVKEGAGDEPKPLTKKKSMVPNPAGKCPHYWAYHHRWSLKKVNCTVCSESIGKTAQTYRCTRCKTKAHSKCVIVDPESGEVRLMPSPQGLVITKRLGRRWRRIVAKRKAKREAEASLTESSVPGSQRSPVRSARSARSGRSFRSHPSQPSRSFRSHPSQPTRSPARPAHSED